MTRWRAGVATVALAPVAAVAFNAAPGALNRLAITVWSDQISVVVNGDDVGVVMDSTPTPQPSGAIAFIALDAGTGAFTDFTLSAPGVNG